MVDRTTNSDRDLGVEPLIAEALLELEQGGEPRLQEFLARHATHAEQIRAGLEQLRRAGVLAPPTAAVTEPRHYGEFRVLRRLAAGGMGVVYLAEQTSLKRQVALKVVRPELLLSPTARERFEREVETIARLQHPGIVPILAVGDEAGVPWFAMEHIEGRSLEAMLDAMPELPRGRSSAGVLRSALGEPPERVGASSGAFAGTFWEGCLRIVLQVAQTMSYVHARGIVHRDLKPSNIMVTPFGQALVLDFGLAHVQDRERVTRTDVPVGSPAYMAPEQVRGEAVDERVDIYALGVTLYQLLTGVLPFVAEGAERLQQAILAGGARAVRAHSRAVPRDVATIVAAAMDRDRGHRYASMADFAADLEAALQRRPIRARPPALWLRFWRTCQRHPTQATVAAALLVLALQFPLLLWQREATARLELAAVNEQLAAANRQQLATNEQLAQANRALRAEQGAAEASFDDALRALREMSLRVGQEELAGAPGSEPLRLGILERALRLYQRLRQRRGGEPRLELDTARTLQYVGSMHDTLGREDLAMANYREAFAVLAGVAGEEAATVRGVNYKKLGQLLTGQGQHVAAAAALREAQCELQDLVGRHDEDRGLRRHLAEVCNSLALVCGELGDAAQKLQLLELAQHHKQRLFDEARDDLGGASALALGCSNLAGALEAAGRRSEALALIQSGIEALERLLPTGAEGVNHRMRLASLYARRGAILQATGSLSQAEADHGRALALRMELHAEFPSTAVYANLVGGSLHDLALVQLARRDHAAAARLETESIERHRLAVRMAPRRPLYAQHLEFALVGLCACVSGQALLPAVDDLFAAAVSVDGLLNAARLYVRCASLAARDGAAAAVVAELRQKAILAIEKAIAKGFRDAEHFESERWARFYEDLRDLPAFESLLTKLRENR